MWLARLRTLLCDWLPAGSPPCSCILQGSQLPAHMLASSYAQHLLCSETGAHRASAHACRVVQGQRGLEFCQRRAAVLPGLAAAPAPRQHVMWHSPVLNPSLLEGLPHAGALFYFALLQSHEVSCAAMGPTHVPESMR